MSSPLSTARGRLRERLGSGAVLAALALACATSGPPIPGLPPPPPALPALPEIPPVDAPAEIAAAREAAGDLAAERSHLEAAIRADPALFEARLDLAELLLDHGSRIEEADALLAEAHVLRSGDARLARLEGVSREAHGDEAGAAEAYARSLALRPDPELGLRRGILLRRLGCAADAIVALEAVRDARLGDRVARSNLADLYEAQGRAADAERELTALADGARGDPAPLRRLADFYLRRGDARRARRALSEAARLAGSPRVLRPLRPASR